MDVAAVREAAERLLELILNDDPEPIWDNGVIVRARDLRAALEEEPSPDQARIS
jgi:hypothetical protein